MFMGLINIVSGETSENGPTAVIRPAAGDQ